MFSSVESGSSTVPAFLNKLWTLVDDTSTNSLICWDPTGKSFHIYDQGHFAKEILPLYFKHSNIASFIRQLNMYGFRKVVNIEQGGLKTERDDMEFSHPYFQRDQEHLLEFIKRKQVNTTVRQETPKVGNTEILKVLSDVRSMKGKQDSLNTNLSDLKRENAALWREVAALRQKHIKQQQIVNKLIQFLVTLVGNNRGLNASMKRKLPLMINDASQLKSSKMQPDFASQLTIEDARDDDFQEENIQTSGPTIKDITYTYNSINTAKMNDTQSQPQTQQQQQPQQSSSHQTLKMDGNVIQFTPEQLQKLAKEGILTIVSDAGPITGATVSAQSPTSFSSVPSVTTSVQDAKSPPSYAYVKTEKNSPIIQMPKTPQPSASRSSASDVGEISAGQPTASMSAGYSSVLPSGSGSGASYIPPSTITATTSDSKTPAVPSDALAINDATSALSRPTVRRQRSLLLSSNDIEHQSDISDQLEVLQADLESVKDILTSQGSGIPGLDSGTLFNLFGEDLDLFAGMSSTPGDTNATADSSNFITGNELIQYQGEPDMFDLFGIQESSDPVDPDALASYSASLDTPLLHIPDDVDLLAEAARKATTSTGEVD